MTAWRNVGGAAVLLALGLWAWHALAAPAGEAQAGAIVYVDKDGRGGACNDGRGAAEAQNPATPVCTIPRGIAIAPAGGRVVVRAGSYPALDVSGGNRSTWLTIAGAPGEGVTLSSLAVTGNASWLRFEHFTIPGGMRIQEGSSHDIALAGSDVHNNGDVIDIRWGTSNVTIEGNHITGGGEGVALTSTSTRPGSPPGAEALAPIRNVTIRNNHFEAIGTDAVRPANFDTVVVEGNEIEGVSENGDHSDALQSVFGGDHLIFRNNYVHDNNAEGFFIKDGHVNDVTFENNVFAHNHNVASMFNVYDTDGLRIVNNTFADNDSFVTLRDGLRNVVIRNNIFQRLDADATNLGTLRAAVVQDHNLIAGSVNWSARGGDIAGRPTYVNAAARDYRLAAGSAGIDIGSADGAPAQDKACRARYDDPATPNRGAGSPPYIDAGALEYAPGTSAADTAAPAGCAAPPPAAKAPTRLHVTLRAYLRRGRALLTARTPGVCRLALKGRVRWKRHGHRRSARLRATARAVKPNRVNRLRIWLPKRAVAAAHAHHRVMLRLSVRATGCAGQQLRVARTLRLRR